MLVLTRKAGESVCIGDEIEVRIISVRGQKVRIAIDAPQSIAVRRSELERSEARLKLQQDSNARSTSRRRAVS